MTYTVMTLWRPYHYQIQLAMSLQTSISLRPDLLSWNVHQGMTVGILQSGCIWWSGIYN